MGKFSGKHAAYLVGASSAIALASAASAQSTTTAVTSTETEAGTSQPAADAQAAPAANSNDQGNDIVVYAQRRAGGESVQRVPIAVTAIDSSVLAATHATSLTDLGGLAPGARLAALPTTPGLPAFTIRGVGVNSSTRSVDPAVNVIQDGMVIAYPAGAIASTFDLESIEVLRGPQGVLFGRNATGGAIVLRTRQPLDHFQALFDFSYGNFNEIDANASVEGPLAPDISAKLAVFFRSNSGTIHNTNHGTFVVAPANPTGAASNHPTGNVGDVNELTFKPTFRFRFSNDAHLTLYTQYARYNDDGSIIRAVPPPAGAANPLVRTFFGYTPGPAGYETNIQDPGYVRLREGHVIAEFVKDFGSGGTWTTNAAYRRISYDSTLNLSGTPFGGLILNDNREDNHQDSIESRYNVGLFSGVDLTAGIFYLHSVTDVLENRTSRLTSAPTSFLRGQFSQDTSSVAGYANLDWHIVPTLTLSLGGRYSTEKKEISFTPVLPCVNGLSNCPQTNFLNDDHRWKGFTPRAVLAWQATPRILFYGSYTSGFRSGNYNPRVSTANGLGVGPVDPETVNALELGAKTDFLDRRLRFNISLYRNQYKDIQQIVSIPQQVGGSLQELVNVARGRIQGVEAEVTIRPVSGVTLEGNLAYTDAQYTKFLAPIVGVADPFALRLPNVSKWSYYLAASFRQPIASLDGAISARVSYEYRSGFVSDFLNTPGTFGNSRGLTNASLTLDRGDYSIGVYARNLFNVYYWDTSSAPFAYTQSGGAPRTYGIRVTARFQ